jgi:hypothetical protein
MSSWKRKLAKTSKNWLSEASVLILVFGLLEGYLNPLYASPRYFTVIYLSSAFSFVVSVIISTILGTKE